MRVTLMHNPTAGRGHPTGDELKTLLRAAGHKVRYQSTKKKKYARALAAPADLIVVAGGDGAIRKIALELVGSDVPFAVLPLGTANNIAKSLGISGTLAEIIASWQLARRCRLNVGQVRTPWGKTSFIEGMGCGLFTDVMAALDVREKSEPALFAQTDNPLGVAVRALHDALADYRAVELRATLDGADISGRYLMLEALNIRHVGPNLFLAPDADPSDGYLDFVLCTEDKRREVADYLAYRLEGKQAAPFLPVRKGKSLKLTWPGCPFRLDDKLWPSKQHTGKKDKPQRAAPVEIEIRLRRKSLAVLLPA
jgi:diacylglycerol kinase family enzyme